MSSSCALNPLNKPCGSCPWRVNQEASDIPNFDLEKAERLRNCSPDINGMGPSYLDPIFACHQSRVGEEFACAGWLAKVGHATLAFDTSLARVSSQQRHSTPALAGQSCTQIIQTSSISSGGNRRVILSKPEAGAWLLARHNEIYDGSSLSH